MNKPAPQARSQRPRFRDTALASGLLDDAQITAAERSLGMVKNGEAADPEAEALLPLFERRSLPLFLRQLLLPCLP